MTYKVPFIDYPKQYKSIKSDIDEAYFRCINQGDFIFRKDTVDFENNLAKLVGKKYGISCDSCTNAMFLSLYAYGIGKGDEVITVDHTYIATIDAIIHAGAKPVLVDIREDFNMNPVLIEQAITPRTRAIIPVHLNGRSCLVEDSLVINMFGEKITIKQAVDNKIKYVVGIENNKATLVAINGYSVSEFDGDLFTIELSNGKVIKCTGDHPIYTQRGWISANLVDSFDSVATLLYNNKHEKNLVKRIRKNIKKNLPESEIKGRNTKIITNIYMDSDKITCTRNGVMLKNRIKAFGIGQNKGQKNGEIKQDFKCLSSGIDRWRRYNNNFMEHIWFNANGLSGNNINRNKVLSREYRASNIYAREKQTTKRWDKKNKNLIPINDCRIYPSKKFIGKHIPILNIQEGSMQGCNRLYKQKAGFTARNKIQQNRFLNLRESSQHANERTAFERIVSISVQNCRCLVYNLQTSSHNYFANDILVHNCDMDTIMGIAQKHKLLVFEDNAQSLGAKYKGVPTGQCGDTSSYSFYPAKILGSYGDGGAICTNDAEIASKLYRLRDHGENPSYLRNYKSTDNDIKFFGFNSLLDNMQAAFLNVKLKHLNDYITRRRKIASMYEKELYGIGDIALPYPPDNGDYFDVYQNYVVLTEKRNALAKFLKDNGIETLIKWYPPNYKMEGLKGLLGRFYLPSTDYISNQCLSLPMYPELDDWQVEYVISKVSEFYGE